MNCTQLERKPELKAALPFVPKDGLAGLKENWKSEIVSGFILFLIALPLCLGIAIASGVPPMAGIIAAIVGGVLVSVTNGSYVTINGPAAGLIVVIIASVERLGGGETGYYGTLGAIVISGLILFVAGICKAGRLGDFFPSSVVHGMLAAIGVIIMSKQLPFVLGVKPPSKEALELIMAIPQMITHLNPEIAFIGLLSLGILILHSLTPNKTIKKIPAPIIVVAVAMALGHYFDLQHQHTDIIARHAIQTGPNFLVSVPLNFMDGIKHPDFSQISSYAFWLSVFSITLIQGIESMLSCSAVDRLDPYKRHANLSRDVAAVGLGSAISGMLGGLPMIAEIVRSTANIANGAKTRWSNFFHGTFMLLFVVTAAAMINQIPLAALAALLVFTGYRLASPKVFKETMEIGLDQMLIFSCTLLVTLSTDLLIGVCAGVACKFAMHLIKGARISNFFSPDVRIVSESKNHLVTLKGPAIFSNYIPLKMKLSKIPQKQKVRFDLSAAKLVDHTVMEHLSHFAAEYDKAGGEFLITGLDKHIAASSHPMASRSL